MNRKDSACEGPYFSHFSNKESTASAISTGSHKLDKSTPISATSFQSIQMDVQRRSIESRSGLPKRDSTVSSSERSSSRSKGRGHSSKPSSHRTSFTIVDPSRPSRHYRVKSSHTVPAANGHDIDDVLALHFRSYSLFTNPSYQASSRLPSTTSPLAPDAVTISDKTVIEKQSEETIEVAEPMNTTMHWTSPSTRRREYERIDRANNGFRGFFRKVVPRCVSGPPEKFYEKDQSDTGSVRRYRLDDVDEAMAEKEMLRSQVTTCDKSVLSSNTATKKSKWFCF